MFNQNRSGHVIKGYLSAKIEKIVVFKKKQIFSKIKLRKFKINVPIKNPMKVLIHIQIEVLLLLTEVCRLINLVYYLDILIYLP